MWFNSTKDIKYDRNLENPIPTIVASQSFYRGKLAVSLKK